MLLATEFVPRTKNSSTHINGQRLSGVGLNGTRAGLRLLRRPGAGADSFPLGFSLPRNPYHRKDDSIWDSGPSRYTEVALS